MEKRFLIQVTCDERTRELWDDAELQANLQGFVERCFRRGTEGSEPRVSVCNISGLDLHLTARS